MTIDELRSSIKFTHSVVADDLVRITATLQLHTARHYSKEEVEAYKKNEGGIVPYIRESLVKAILNSLYEDKRKELYDTMLKVSEAHMAHNYADFDRLRSLAMELARYQPPKEYNE